jgi:hypothetical protein
MKEFVITADDAFLLQKNRVELSHHQTLNSTYPPKKALSMRHFVNMHSNRTRLSIGSSWSECTALDGYYTPHAVDFKFKENRIELKTSPWSFLGSSGFL